MANTTGKKFGGRKPGTPNRTTEQMRAVIGDIIYENLPRIRKAIKDMPDKDAIIFIEKLLRHVLPAQRTVDLTTDLSGLNDQQLDYIINSLISKEDDNTNE